jgi:hypothetical protein
VTPIESIFTKGQFILPVGKTIGISTIGTILVFFHKHIGFIEINVL